MDNLPPISSPVGAPTSLPPASDADVVTLVNARKWALVAVFAIFLFFALILAMRALLARPNLPLTDPLAIFLEWISIFRLLGGLAWCIPIGVAVAIWNLGRALKIKLALLLALLSLLGLVRVVPLLFIGLVILLFLNWRAVRQLKAAGYRVGVWGAKIR